MGMELAALLPPPDATRCGCYTLGATDKALPSISGAMTGFEEMKKQATTKQKKSVRPHPAH
jgi:hypothetical protein